MTQDNPLSDNLKSYEQARKEEMSLGFTGTSDELADKARERLFALLPDASQELQTILRIGTKDDAVRFQAVKFVFEYTLGKPNPRGTDESDTDKILRALLPPTTIGKE